MALTPADYFDLRVFLLKELSAIRDSWAHDEKGWLAAQDCLDRVADVLDAKILGSKKLEGK